MKAIEYITEVTTNGKFQIPPEILKKFHIYTNLKVKVLLLFEEKKEKKDINRFCGKWQDDRKVDDIISEVYKNREGNIRSDRIKL